MKTNPAPADRDRFGALLSRSFMRLCYSAHLLYADLHPGNYLFMPDGRLGLIDFGCARRYTPAEVAYLTSAEQAAFISQDAVRAAVIAGADLPPSRHDDAEHLRLMVAWYNWNCEPITTLEPFDFGDETYLQRGMAIWRELLRGRHVRTLPVNGWLAKSFIGLRAMLLNLKARVPLGRLLREETTVPLPPFA